MASQLAVFVASLAVASAIFAAQSGLFVISKPRTKLHGPVFDGGKGSRFTWSHSTDTAGRDVGVLHLVRDPGPEGPLAGKTNAPPLHLHLTQEECFKVREGIIGYTVNGEDQQLRAGDAEVCHPPGTKHTVWSDDTTTAG